ncbi:unnamed protein product, partial [Closterium sp. NIES-53]
TSGMGPVVLTGLAGASWVDDSATQGSSQGYTFTEQPRSHPFLYPLGPGPLARRAPRLIAPQGPSRPLGPSRPHGPVFLGPSRSTAPFPRPVAPPQPRFLGPPRPSSPSPLGPGPLASRAPRPIAPLRPVAPPRPRFLGPSCPSAPSPLRTVAPPTTPFPRPIAPLGPFAPRPIAPLRPVAPPL